MSFKQRLVTPIFVSRIKVDKSAKDELEWVANHTMSNIIIQLSSLARHAEDLFADLCRSTSSLNQRAASLNSKISQLAEKVSQFDPTEEEVLLHEVQKRSQYKSTEQHDQQVVSRITMSQAIQDLYNMCARPPPLDKLNMYRDDGKDCMKYYTDPSYFFQLWLLSIQEDIEKKKDLKKKRGKARKQNRTVQVKPKDVTSIRERNKHRGMGAEFVNDVVRTIPNGGAAVEQNQQTPTYSDSEADNNYPPPPPVINQYSLDEDLPPPPPPPPFEEGRSAPPPLSMVPQGTPATRPLMTPNRPPPPPPPPFNGATAPPPPPPLDVGKEPQNAQLSQKPDRGDLLSQIKDGNKVLKKIEERKHQEKPQDVHSMMTQLFVARRQALEDSDSNDDGDDDDDDDEEWDDD